MQDDRPVCLSLSDLQAGQFDQPVYLGRHGAIDYFACRSLVKDSEGNDQRFESLRAAGRRVSPLELELLFYAQGLLNWHRNHAFCSRCGSASAAEQSGHARRCTNLDCGKLQYPKIDPAVIFSIINTVGPVPKILLGRKAEWDAQRRSVIAGFVEPGERLEDAVRREAWEETGLEVDHVRYIDSQPWPFPDALMLGFSCETRQSDIRLIDRELESAEWFSAEEIEAGLRTGSLQMPYEVSIAWHLIDRWFQAQRGYSVDDIKP